MRKLICLIVLMGMLAYGSTALAESRENIYHSSSLKWEIYKITNEMTDEISYKLWGNSNYGDGDYGSIIIINNYTYTMSGQLTLLAITSCHSDIESNTGFIRIDKNKALNI